MKLFLAFLIAPFFYLFIWLRSAPAYRGTMKPFKWYRALLNGCVSSDGSPYYAYYKKGSVNKLMIFFSGGGAAWNEETAARPNTLKNLLTGAESYYFAAVFRYLEVTLSGILSAKKREHNPLADWNVLYIPYASADFHVGNRDFAYTALDGKPRVLFHHGRQNAEAALDSLPAEFSNPEILFIAGESAGGFGCIAHAPEIAARFPNAKSIVVYSDSAQIKLRPGQWQELLRDAWNADARYRDGLGDDTQLAAFWFERAHRALGDRALLLHSNSTGDEILTPFQYKLTNNRFVTTGDALLQFQQGLAEAAARLRKLPTYRCYITDQRKNPDTGLTYHTISRWAQYTADRCEGLTVAEWLGGALSGGEIRSVGVSLLEDL